MSTAVLILAVLGALALALARLYLAPFSPCPRCHGTSNIAGGRRRPVCSRCKGRRRVQRTGSRTLHRIVRQVRNGRQAAAQYQQQDDSRGTP